jgi:hypothetical protein
MDILPSELWTEIILCMDYDTMKKFRNVNNSTKDLFIKIRKLLVDKFSKDLTNISQRREFNEKIKLIKNRMKFVESPTYDEYLIIHYNDLYININQYTKNFENLKHTKGLKYAKDLIYIQDLSYAKNASFKIKLEIENLLHLKYGNGNPKPRFLNERGINELNNKIESIPFNFLQLYKNLCLSENGYVYSLNYPENYNESYKLIPIKLNKLDKLVKMKEIIDRYQILSVDGDIYKFSENEELFFLETRVNNIIKVCSQDSDPYGFISYYLDNKGKITIIHSTVYNDSLSEIETGKNIIEISTFNLFLCALDDNMKLYVYFYDNFIKEYDLLNL